MDEVTIPPKVEHFICSDSLNELFGALAKAQSKFKPVVKGNVNPFFKSKYADLQAVIDATKEALSQNGLTFVQLPGIADNMTAVTTILGHSSGQWIRATLKMPTAKGDAQGIGSAITYARRYALQAILGVSAEEDDDGNAAVSEPKGKKSKGADEPTLVSTLQLSVLFAEGKKHGWSNQQMKDLFGKWGYEKSADLQDKDYEGILEQLSHDAPAGRPAASVSDSKPEPTYDPSQSQERPKAILRTIHITAVKEPKTAGKPYFVEGFDVDSNEWSFSSFHKATCNELKLNGIGKDCILITSTTIKGDKTYFNLDGWLQIADRKNPMAAELGFE